jgi:hypothetical protein
MCVYVCIYVVGKGKCVGRGGTRLAGVVATRKWKRKVICMYVYVCLYISICIYAVGKGDPAVRGGICLAGVVTKTKKKTKVICMYVYVCICMYIHICSGKGKTSSAWWNPFRLGRSGGM